MKDVGPVGSAAMKRFLLAAVVGPAACGPSGEPSGDDLADTPDLLDSTEDLGFVPTPCRVSTTPVSVDDETLGFTAADLLQAAPAPFSTVTWSVRTADVAAEPMSLTCSTTPTSAALVTREIVGSVDDPSECMPGPELRAGTTCTLDIGHGGFTAAASATFQGSRLDALGLTFVADEVEASATRLHAAVDNATVGRVSVIVAGPLSDALVEIDLHDVSAPHEVGVTRGWVGQARP